VTGGMAVADLHLNMFFFPLPSPLMAKWKSTFTKSGI